MPDYTPNPIAPASADALPPELHPLREQLAANAHEVWSAARMAQGWTWGPVRDDALKQHPCLIPYDQLPESEKLLDRNAVSGALAAIRHFGWRLQPPVGLPGTFVIPQDPGALRAAWDARDDEQRPYALDDYRAVAKHALRLGELLLASDAARAGLRYYPADPVLTHAAGRALAEMRRPSAARALIEPLIAAGPADSESLGLLARTHKDEGFSRLAAGLPADDSWAQAAFIYARAFEQHQSYFNGINAATMAFFRGDHAASAGFAAASVELARIDISDPISAHWALATLGEAALLRRQWAEAADHYRLAVAKAGARSTDVVSMGRQARRIRDAWARAGELTEAALVWIEEVFPRFDVAVFSGHRFDRPDRATPRFREADAETVKAGIAAWLDRTRPQAVYCSLSVGADLLFAESALARKIPLHLVLPVGPDELSRMEDQLSADWCERLARACTGAASLLVPGSDRAPANPSTFGHCNRVFTGLARLKADSLDVHVSGLAVWNGRPGDGEGGTADCVALWRDQGIPVEVIATGAPPSSSPSPTPPKPVARENPPSGLAVRAMLFADVKGFSKLTEAEVFVFGQKFMESLAHLLDHGSAGHEMVNTWGDGIFIVFDDVTKAGRFALALRDLVHRNDWKSAGLNHALGIRIGLHVGPVLVVPKDPVLKHPQYYGAHVNRAARIEPITEVGQVYASDSFAALVRQAPESGLTFDYVGSTPLAKNFGQQRLFRVDRA